MKFNCKPTLLAIGLASLRSSTNAIDIYTASTLREAIATIRLVRFDLLVVGLDRPELDVWELMRRVLTAWPHQRWILASEFVTAQDEIQARSLGALLVLGGQPEEAWLAELVESLRERESSRSSHRCLPTDTRGALDGSTLAVEAR